MPQKKIIGALALISLVTLTLAGCSQTPGGTPLTASGTVEATNITISPEIGGRVVEVNAQEGGNIKVGQMLLRLDDSILQAQIQQAEAAVASAQAGYDLLAAGPTQAQLRQAEAAVVAARAAYSRTVDATRPSDITAAKAVVNAAVQNYNKVKAGPTEEDIAAVQAALRNAEAVVKSAQSAYDAAYKQNPAAIGASPAAVQLEQATNNYNAAKAQYDKVAKGADNAQLAAASQQVQSAAAVLDKAQQPARSFDVEQAQAQIDQAQAQLDQLRQGARKEQLAAAKAQVDAALAALDILKAQLKKLTLTAPIDGEVLSRAIEPGEMAAPGAPVMTLARLDDLHVTVYVPEDRYAQVRLGQTAQVSTDSFPGQVFTGSVDRIADQAEFTPRNVQTAEGRSSTVYAIRLKVNNPDSKLKVGAPVDVVFGTAGAGGQ